MERLLNPEKAFFVGFQHRPLPRVVHQKIAAGFLPNGMTNAVRLEMSSNEFIVCVGRILDETCRNLFFGFPKKRNLVHSYAHGHIEKAS